MKKILLAVSVFLAAALLFAEDKLPDLKNLKWNKNKCVAIEGDSLTAQAEKPGWSIAAAPVDLSGLDGRQLIFTIRAKAENVSSPSAHFRGVKFMLNYTDAFGKKYNRQPYKVSGTFEKELKIIADMPSGVRDGKLFLGLQDVTGKVTFDLSSLKVSENKSGRKKVRRAPKRLIKPNSRELKLTFACGTPERFEAEKLPYASVNDGILSIFVSPGDGRDAMRIVRIPIDCRNPSFLGKTVLVTGEIRMTDVTQAKDPWNGVKGVLYHKVGGRSKYPAVYTNQYPSCGTYPWRTFRGKCKLPENATDVSLILGLQDCDGVVDFRDITLSIN